MDQMDYFVELYGNLPRAGPGDNACTRKAFEMIPHLPPEPRILDIGCGPGMQTLELLRLSQGTLVALDLMPQMIFRLRETAEKAGVADRLETVQADMHEMTFEPESFDLVWSEGAIYFLGFQQGLRKIKDLVKPGGYVAVSEAVWLEANPPREVIEFWKAYPEIDTVENKLLVGKGLGYDIVGHFVLPRSSWMDLYYNPLEAVVRSCEQRWKEIPEAQAVLAEAREEMDMFKEHAQHYGYAFFVLRKQPGQPDAMAFPVSDQA